MWFELKIGVNQEKMYIEADTMEQALKIRKDNTGDFQSYLTGNITECKAVYNIFPKGIFDKDKTKT